MTIDVDAVCKASKEIFLTIGALALVVFWGIFVIQTVHGIIGYNILGFLLIIGISCSPVIGVIWYYWYKAHHPSK